MQYLLVPPLAALVEKSWSSSAPGRQGRRIGRKHSDRAGMVVIAVLIVVVLLSLAAYQYANLMTSEYRASTNDIRLAQAHAAAVSGIHRVAAVLAEPGGLENTLSGNPYDNTFFQNIRISPEDSAPRVKAMCSVLSPRVNDPNSVLGPCHGVECEQGKINPNALMAADPTGKMLFNMLMLLPNMTQDIANSIVYWVDPAAQARTSSDGGMGAADNTYYLSLSPPYQAKNGPLNSIEELLFVKDVTPNFLFGMDSNRNGIQDANEMSGTDGTFDRGWSQYLTIYSREPNNYLDATGSYVQKINLVKAAADTTTTDATTGVQTTIPGVPLDQQYEALAEALGDDMAKYVMMVRLNSTQSAATLIAAANAPPPDPPAKNAQANPTIESLAGYDVTAMKLDTTTKTSGKINTIYDLVDTGVQIGQKIYLSPLLTSDPNTLRTILPDLWNKCTVNDDVEVVGRINVLTASPVVLQTLPNMTQDYLDAILAARPDFSTSNDTPGPIFQTPTWLLTEVGLPPALVKSWDKYVTCRSQVYRFQSLGFFEGGGPAVRLEAVVDMNYTSQGAMPRIVFQRDITGELGKGYDPNQNK